MNDRPEILERLTADEKFLLTTHENPDGDALGSLVAMNGILQAIGKDTVMFMRETEFPLPYEYRYLLAEDGAIHFEPGDLAERTVIFLDCGSFDRMRVDFLKDGGKTLINIDHHHDNTEFGELNMVESKRSSTAEIVYSIAKELKIPLTPFLADALYVGLVTDTGRFMYQNTGPEAHEMAADLLRSGVDVHAAYTRLYEDQPAGKVVLLGRALSTLKRYDDGRLSIVHLTKADFDETESEETWTEGIVDFARAIEGTAVGAMYRQLTGEGREHLAKISLRSSDNRVDVSVIARSFNGGGHKQAAGATTEKSIEEATELIRAGIREQLGDRQVTAA
ncbi:MAG: DHH family phosphoesterase [Solirubrobacterales bacterium]